MYFRHSTGIWRDYPELTPGVLFAKGISTDADAGEQAGPFLDLARRRLASATESELPEIKAWRRAFAKMGLKPTQYRCASESLLRRFRKEGTLPALHPLIDLCNAISLAFAIPIAVIDIDHVTGGINVRHATGDEDYQTFAGEHEHPEPGEVIFADEAGRAHARRWTNRQSGLSAVSAMTTNVLIVAEAMHESAEADVERLVATVSREISAVWGCLPQIALLSATDPVFEC
jgi:DNA/RNA-binding domain of Phe-tRNA-synthetase-like protein